eukprot:TRINITY_DN7607_c0_g1_i1.p1 TRINITY_DN7607_c0_g1~~TRINITY_DN7607_c0_g1_i1.p1  ORF type:complete len:306 (+),score=87.19 TRINITY_DN7607_c0_g1_i1:29-919(+)
MSKTDDNNTVSVDTVDNSSSEGNVEASGGGGFDSGGDYHATYVPVVVAKSDVESWLPEKLTLNKDADFKEGTWMVWFIFGTQKKVGVDHGFFSKPIFQLNYHEFMLVVPEVKEADSGKIFAYLPRWYLDERSPAIMGRLFFGLQKTFADIEVKKVGEDKAKYEISLSHWFAKDTPVIDSSFSYKEGEPIPFEEATRLRKLFDNHLNLPWATDAPLKGWRELDFKWGFQPDTEITAVNVNIHAGSGFLDDQTLDATVELGFATSEGEDEQRVVHLKERAGFFAHTRWTVPLPTSPIE